MRAFNLVDHKNVVVFVCLCTRKVKKSNKPIAYLG